MKWHNAARDYLPGTSRSVLISYKGVYHVAFFNKENNTFAFSSGGANVVAQADISFYWTDIDRVPKTEPRFVLIVEDDPDDQELINREIRQIMPSANVDVVSDGQEALDYLLRQGHYSGGTRTPDLMLLDLNLPKVDGFSVLREIRKHERLRNMIVFVVSTSRSTDQWNAALDLGARCFFNKGSSSKDIKQIVQEICANLY